MDTAILLIALVGINIYIPFQLAKRVKFLSSGVIGACVFAALTGGMVLMTYGRVFDWDCEEYAMVMLVAISVVSLLIAWDWGGSDE